MVEMAEFRNCAVQKEDRRICVSFLVTPKLA